MVTLHLSELNFIQHFWGDKTKIKSFINSVKLARSLYPEHEVIILAFIKTRLEGAALAISENAQNLDELIIKLQERYDRPESASVIIAELSNLQPKENHKIYLSEVQSLTDRLTDCYVSHGVPINYAIKVAETTAAQSMYDNCKDRRFKNMLTVKMNSSLDEIIAL